MQENSSIWDVVNEGKTMWKRWASVVHLWDFFGGILLVNVGGFKGGSQVLR